LQAGVFSAALLYVPVANAQSKEEVYAYIIQCGIKHPEVVMRQCLLETGHLKSPYLMKRNNLFAFRVTEEYMKFAHWKESVEYYKRWQQRHYKNHKEGYYTFLKRIKYSEAGHYLEVLRKVKVPSTAFYDLAETAYIP